MRGRRVASAVARRLRTELDLVAGSALEALGSVLDLLPAHPVVSVDIAATRAGVSATAARGALD